MSYSQQDYLNTFLNLLPQGRLWDKEPGSPMYQAIASLILTISRLSDSASNLLTDSFIGTTDFLLPEWQASLGLPDECQPANATFIQQRNQAIARFIGVGGQSVSFIIQYAATLGFDISVTEYTNFHVGSSKAGSKLGNLAFSWLITAPAELVDYFKVGSSKVCEKLVSLDSDVLVCEISAIQPAHSLVYYQFV
jgi:uncharacterized protein YmfQ (DUF2313 family)